MVVAQDDLPESKAPPATEEQRTDEPNRAESRTPQNPLNPADVPAALEPGNTNELMNFGDDDAWNEATGQPPGGTASSRLRLQQVPDVLKPGGDRSATNPFVKRKPVAQASGTLTTDAFSKLDISDTGSSTNPWQQAIDPNSGPAGQPTPQPRPVTAEGVESDPWAANNNPPLTQPNLPSKSPVLISPNPEDGVPSAWKEVAHKAGDKAVVEPPPPENAAAGQAARIDDWSLIDQDSPSHPPTSAHADGTPGDLKPPLPSRSTGLRQKWVPSRQAVDAKSETYQIKNIQWHDPSSDKNPRASPILIQNENGPCPLVALVNALTMTTPADGPETTLVEILRPREQISLDLLLKAVFDELMSPRRTGSEAALPDVSDLYAFLQSLHTGMNVNPRFIPTPEMEKAYKRTSLTHLHPTERGNLIPGTFENTTEMSLYATFSIPLIHGWLPARSDPVYSAMERRAASYEDVQNLLFCEEELTNKLSSHQGLTEDEQQLYQDIMTIKMFLDSSATQLTAWGIEVMRKAMRPGTFAILFRNDHFSTLYCHPDTLQLLSLVTDAGYHKHEKVVWESLVDVTGEHAEYLSGDCRVVGSSSEAGPGPSDGVSSTADRSRGDWTTVRDKRGKNIREDAEATTLSPHEQEDRDLALALQLQEEEDQRHREERSRRQREGILSERRSPNSYSVPVSLSGTTQSRRSSPSHQQTAPQQQVVRPLVPRRRPGVTRRAESNGEDAPPPSYEQAAQDPAYVPPAGHPNHSQSSIATSTHTTGVSGPGLGNAQSTQSTHGQRTWMNQPPRRQHVNNGATGGGRDRNCVAM
ncbi:hypothetical protein EsDP_00002893 [Epichloe bromicola]|uniref:MINDY deubiquitinase domain-containing protein n=1 Tax=Epichloe bromicola TaxID=79588 RepID=A0ABQ0CM70_9HYPO